MARGSLAGWTNDAFSFGTPRLGSPHMAGERCAVVIEAKGLSKRYGSKVAVDDLSFDVRPAA